MIRGYRLTRHVEQHFGLEVASRVVDDLRRSFELLATNPEAGHRRKDLTRDASLRFWAVGPTLIAYKSAIGWIEVLFVERADLHWERLLEGLDE